MPVTSTLRVALVNMPFASLSLPSLALTQLSAVLRRQFGDRVAVTTHYLNLDFARFFGDRRYYSHIIADAGFLTGVGDWFFRQSAFPGAPDNTSDYFSRFYFDDSEETRAVRSVLVEKRRELDAFLDRLIEVNRLAEADIVGFTTMFSQTVPSIAMARRIKQRNPRAITIVGGAAFHGVMGQEFARQDIAMDYVFSGSGLISLPTFVQHCLDDNRAACSTINGVFPSEPSRPGFTAEAQSTQSQISSALSAPRRCSSSQILLADEPDINDDIPLDYGPFLDAFDRAFPERELKPVLLFETSRGCSWAEKSACSFCGLNGLHLHYRAKSPENALSAIRSLFCWAPRCPSFIAVDTIVPREYLKSVFPQLGTPPGMRILYEVRPDLTEDEIRVLCEAGIVAVQPGIEALSSSTLKLMRKGTTAFGNIRFLKACSRHPISLDWNLLLGSPGEPESVFEKYLRDIPLLTHLPPPTGAYPINFVRYSRYFEEAAAYGLNLQPQDFYALTYPFEPAALANIAHLFVDPRAAAGATDAWVARLNEQVAWWRSRWVGSDGKPQARLCLLDDPSASIVYDSRGGDEEEHTVDATARRILDQLVRPARAEDLDRALPDLQPSVIREALATLTERRLLFEEDGRFLSLITS